MARSSISRLALRVNVSSSMSLAGMPCSASQARRWTMVRVLPLPAPAMTSTGPSGAVTASSCAGLSVEMSITGTPWEGDASGCRAAARTHAFRRAGEIALRAMPARFASPPSGHGFAVPWGKFPPISSGPPQCSEPENRFHTIAASLRTSGILFAGLVSRKSVPHKNTNAPKTQKFWGRETDFRFWVPQPCL